MTSLLLQTRYIVFTPIIRYRNRKTFATLYFCSEITGKSFGPSKLLSRRPGAPPRVVQRIDRGTPGEDPRRVPRAGAQGEPDGLRLGGGQGDRRRTLPGRQGDRADRLVAGDHPAQSHGAGPD